MENEHSCIFRKQKAKDSRQAVFFYAKNGDNSAIFAIVLDSSGKSFCSLAAHRLQKSSYNSGFSRICCLKPQIWVKQPFCAPAEQRRQVAEGSCVRVFFLGAHGKQPLFGEHHVSECVIGIR